jgi:chromosome segregation ATPase
VSSNITVELAQAQDEVSVANKEIERLRQATSEISAMNRQLDELRQRVEVVDSLEAANREQEGKIQELTENYKKEMALRKKYKNEIENMKGKIRVFARCRPMAEYEITRGSQQVVKFIDDCTLELDTSRGPKTFEFDAVYSMTSTQEEVFEDVRSLVESCLDGYNVCVFAYGQVSDMPACSIQDSLPFAPCSYLVRAVRLALARRSQ